MLLLSRKDPIFFGILSSRKSKRSARGRSFETMGKIGTYFLARRRCSRPRPMRPAPNSEMVPGSGTPTGATAVKVPDWELVMFLPEVKSAATHVPLGQKYN
jgi:hypothetical protein